MNLPINSLLEVPDQFTFAGGVALVCVGVYLRWRMGDFAMKAEEYVKERQLTEDQARLRVRVLSITGPAAIIVGLTACAVVVWT